MNTVAITGGEIVGNIGSCQVNTERVQTGFWTTQEIAVDSCSGEIISQAEFFDHGFLWFGLLCAILLTFFISAIN